METNEKKTRGIRLRSLLRSLSPRGAVSVAFVAGVGSLAGFDAGVHLTNAEDFCISCHEMAAAPYEEYKQTVHFKNAAGVRATCADCHVPAEWNERLIAKVRASKDVYHHLIGTLDTPEKFELHRLRMAETVWAKMKANDSRECRTCHDLRSMALDEQQGRASRKHQQMTENGQTCIDCHKGVAHELPPGFEDEQ